MVDHHSHPPSFQMANPAEVDALMSEADYKAYCAKQKH